MKKEKYYLVKNEALSASTEIEGIRKQGAIAYSGSIVPAEWFSAMPHDRFQILVGRGDIAPHKATDSEIELLYTCFPSLIPSSAKFKVDPKGAITYQNAWYRVNDAPAWGLVALVDVQGICKAGEIAYSGDIVPAKFFAALSIEQLHRLETHGLFSDSFLEYLAPDVRRNVRNTGFIDRYAVDKYEKEALIAKFPAMSRDYTSKIVQAKEKDEEA